ncbi:ribonuclease H-like domain-containing protein [Tanacetum coccineum]
MKKMYCLVVTDDFSRFSWVFFLATKDETSGILKAFITGIENQINHRVKIIRCDNGSEFKNKEMSQLCEMKGIKREFSVARTPQQNRVAERKNRTLIEAARTMLDDLKLPTTFWAEAVNTACRKLALRIMRPFGCPVTILNTLDHLGSGPKWLFDIDTLKKSMNYKPVVTENQTNGSVGTKESIDAGQAGKKTVSSQEYILLPLLTDPSLSKGLKDSPDAGFKPSEEEEKKDDEDPMNEEEPRVNQEKDASVNSTNTINIVSSTVNVAGIKDNAVDENIVYRCEDDPNMPNLEEIVYSKDDEGVDAETDMNNLNTFMPISLILTTRLHKDHPLEQIIRDIHSTPQTRRMTRSVTDHDLSCIEAMQDEFLQFKLHKVWTLVNLPYGKRAIGTKWVYGNKKDTRGIVIRNKARIVTQGYTQEEGIDYDEVFAPVAKIEAIRLFLAYALFKNFVVYQMDVKSAFLYGKIEEEVYVCQPLRFEDPEFPNRVYKVEKALYGLHQIGLYHDPRAWMSSIGDLTFFLGLHVKLKDDGIFISQDKYVADILEKSMIGSLMYLTASRPGIMFAVCACARDSPFDLEAFFDSDYAGAIFDRKSTTEGVSSFGIGEGECELTLSSLNVVQRFSFFLKIGFTLILATLDGLDVCLLKDVIGEDDCDDDG